MHVPLRNSRDPSRKGTSLQLSRLGLLTLCVYWYCKECRGVCQRHRIQCSNRYDVMMYGVGPREVFLPASDGGAQAPTLILNARGAGPSHPPVPRRVVTNDHPLGRRSVPLLQLRRPRRADRLALGKRCDAGRQVAATPPPSRRATRRQVPAVTSPPTSVARSLAPKP